MIVKMFSLLSKLAILTIVIFLIYGSVQQVYRTSANDPQIQIVRDLCADLSGGIPPKVNFPGDSIDISRSLGVFTVIYNESREPVKSSGYLDGAMPRLPSGVLDYAKAHGEDWITWQPKPGVRMATVVAYLPAPHPLFVAAGRSLKEAEIRVHSLSVMALIAWLLCALIIIFNWALSLRGSVLKTRGGN